MNRILLVAVNAGYVHSSFSLRCLLANMGELADETELVETDVETSPVQLCERLLASRPAIIGFSVYIWNYTYVLSVLRLLRILSPETRLVVGGPQVVPDDPATAGLFTLADCAVVGEADSNVAQTFLSAHSSFAQTGMSAPHSSLAHLQLPYPLYSDEDIAHRVIYAETSRGCPFQCAYCTSAGQGPIRFFPRDPLFAHLETLIRRGARKFKFLDRSFNHNGENGLAVLDFLLRQTQAHLGETFQFHFEFTPCPLSEEWKRRLCLFRPGELHLEVGIQTLDADVARRIGRPFSASDSSYAVLEETLRFLIHEAKADVHADLILGLPGETLDGIADGFNRLVALRPAELQVGILKNLPGTHLGRRFAEYDLRFSPEPPYEILSTSTLPFETLCHLARFARCWELLYNRGRFPASMALLLDDVSTTPFEKIMSLADTLHATHGRLHALSPRQLAVALSALFPTKEMAAALETDARLVRRASRPF